MNELFSQGGKGSTGILTNKQAIARKFNVKQSEVAYFAVGVDLGGYKVIYDKLTQRAYSLPVDITTGTTAVSLDSNAVLTHSNGSVDLGELAVQRREFVTVPGDFTTGSILLAKHEVLVDGGIGYRWGGALPKTVPANSSPSSTGGIGVNAWIRVVDDSLREELASSVGATLVTSAKVNYLPGFTDARQRTLQEKLSDSVSLLDFAEGDGVADEYAAIMDAYNWAAANGKSLYIPAGVYKFSQKLTFSYPEVAIYGAGLMSTSLQFTGTGIAIEFNDDNPNNGIYAFAGGIADLEIVGNANSTILLRNLNVNHWWASRINLRESSISAGVGIKIEGPTGCHLDHIVCSTNAQLMTNRPFAGIWLDAHPISGGRTSCTTIIHPIIEGMKGDGVVMKGCDQTTWIGGTSENNDGNGVTLSESGQPRINTFIGVGFEGNRGFADIYDAGQMNFFENCYTSVLAYFGATSLFSELKGGYHQKITVEGNFISVHDLKYSFFSTGGTFLTKENTKYWNIYNSQTNSIVNLPKPGHLLALTGSPMLFTNMYGFPIDVMMHVDSSAVVTSVFFCEGTTPNVKVDATGGIRLDPGNSLQITYTGSPTFYWMPR